jgi:hypothetical protein
MDIDLEKQEVLAIIDYYRKTEKQAVQDRDYLIADAAKRKIEEFQHIEVKFPSIDKSDLKWGNYGKS